MSNSRLKKLHDAGVSIWLDYIDRTMLRNGDLARRIEDECLTGMTSNPTIFEKALAEGTEYDDQLRIRVTTVEAKGARITHAYEVLRGEEKLCEGRTVVACINREGRVQRLPDWLRS